MKRTASIAIAVLLSTSIAAQTPASPDVLLRAAMQKEQIDNDLPGAIAAYKAIVEKFPKDVSGARALLQLGGIYANAGRPEALETYQRVIEKFPAHQEVVKEAHKRIAAMSIQTIRPTHIQLPIPPHVEGSFGSQVSPDGQYISFISDSIEFNGDGNLGVWNLRTGATRLVTKSAGYKEGYVRESAWSPDGRTLAFTWFNATAKRYEIRTAPSSGGASQTIYTAAPGVVVTVFNWSPTGRHVAAAVQSDKAKPASYQIALVSTQNEPLRILKSLDGVRRPRNGAFSPDARFLAFDYPPIETSPSRDVFLLELETGALTPLIMDAGSDDELLGWFPGSDFVVYSCHWRGTREVRAIQVREGKPFLEPFPIKRDVGEVTSLGFSRDGRFFALKSAGVPDVLVAPMDPVTVTPVGKPTTFPPPTSAGRGQATWSPDGTRAAYFEQTAGTDWTLTVQHLASGSRQSFPAGVREPERPAWHPGGRAIAFHSWNLQNEGGQFRVNLDTGAIDRVSTGHTGAFSPDGQFFFHPSGQTIQKMRLSDGSSHSVDQGPRNALALSPDGLHLAVFDQGVRDIRPSSISIVSTAGGGSRRKILEGFMEESIDNEIAWSHDGRFVFFVTTEPRDIWRLSIEGGAPQRLGLNTGAKHLSMSPDGRQLLISVTGSVSEIWLWENLLPKSARR